MPNNKLGDAELEVMQALWNADRPLSSTELHQQLAGKRGWALSTLMTVLARLCAKGFAACDKSSGLNLYSPVTDEESYKEQESGALLRKLHRNSLPGLVASLYNAGAIDDRDLEELRAYIEKKGGTRQ